MDGRPGTVIRSLRARLFLSLTITIMAAGLGAGVLAYDWAVDEAIELQDATLVQMGALATAIPGSAPSTAGDGVDAEARVMIVPVDDPRSDTGASSHLKALPDGLHTVARNDRSWRMLIKTRSDGSRVGIGQPTAIRDEIARDSALRTVLPLLALIPSLLLIVGFIIRGSLRPVLSLAERLDARQADELQRLPLEGMPEELHPFISSINRLLERIQALIDQQRQFIADAAHELRTPITAISVQAENLNHSAMQPEGRERLAALRSGTRRTAHLLEQLLALARYDMGGTAGTALAPLDQCTKQVVADLLPRATERGVDLGFEIVEPAFVRGEPAMLAVMVRNLIDNAIRHIPKGGRVDIGVYREHARAILQVEDNGSGIAEADLVKIFEPFARGRGVVEDGSGLGLSIVKRIVERLNGSVSLENVIGAGASGLRVTVSLPALDRPVQDSASMPSG